jgi:hypothetical protein
VLKSFSTNKKKDNKMGSNENIATHDKYEVTTFTLFHLNEAIRGLEVLKKQYINGEINLARIKDRTSDIKLDINLAIDNMKLQVKN